MNKFISTKEHASDIIKLENKTSLEKYLHHIIEQKKSDFIEDEVIQIMVNALVAHGKDLNQIRQISQISKLLGQSLGLSEAYCDVLEQAAKVYDIGNIVIKRDVYAKEETLTFEEFESVKKHTEVGYEILSNQTFQSTTLAAIIAKEHHEWWDGGGYPVRMKEKDISTASRIVALADTVGALFRKRPGRKSWSYASIIEYVKKRSGLQFDPEVVNVFLVNQNVIHQILNTDLAAVPSN